MIVPKQQYILIILVVFAYLIKYTAGWEWSQNLFISPRWSDMMILDVQVSSIIKIFPRKLKKKKKKKSCKRMSGQYKLVDFQYRLYKSKRKHSEEMS